MAALDTNVLVRWLTNDDAQQSQAAERLLTQTSTSGERLFVPVTVVLELE
ncbi:MAG: putative nucleic-acid-binding protein [Hydrogenophaga sp.]|jgi:predicted nucleic-acid-binding protein